MCDRQLWSRVFKFSNVNNIDNDKILKKYLYLWEDIKKPIGLICFGKGWLSNIDENVVGDNADH